MYTTDPFCIRIPGQQRAEKVDYFGRAVPAHHDMEAWGRPVSFEGGTAGGTGEEDCRPTEAAVLGSGAAGQRLKERPGPEAAGCACMYVNVPLN